MGKLGILNRIILLFFVALFPLKSLNAAEAAAEAEVDVATKLGDARRAIILSSVEKGSEEKERPMPTQEDQLAEAKSYFNLIYAVVSSDGELTKLEEDSITKIFKSLGNPYVLNNMVEFNAQAIEKAKAGGYKDIDLTPLVEEEIENVRKINDKFSGTQQIIRALLFDSITAAQADGLAEVEKSTAKKVADKFNVPGEVFDWIIKCCEFENQNKNLVQGVDSFYASIHKHYQ